MTVAELIEKLKALPPEVQSYTVNTQGCDCHGEIGDLEVNHEERYTDRTGAPVHVEAYVMLLRP